VFSQRGTAGLTRHPWAKNWRPSPAPGEPATDIWAGINIGPDDLDGRRVGERAGEGAVERASGYFDGSARP
jgi:hypothetical protein